VSAAVTVYVTPVATGTEYFPALSVVALVGVPPAMVIVAPGSGWLLGPVTVPEILIVESADSAMFTSSLFGWLSRHPAANNEAAHAETNVSARHEGAPLPVCVIM
jgi:hypothetical protein